MLKKIFGMFLITLLTLIPATADKDKDKKTYELIYKDIQILKQQLLRLEQKIKLNTEDITSNKKQLEEIITQLKHSLTRQAALKEELKSLPTNYQILLEKLEEMSLQLIKISEELLVIKNSSLRQPSPQEEKVEKKQAPPDKKMEKEKEAEKQKEKKPKPPQLSLSPQEVYNMAYSDYLKGNFELAIDGFKIYREHFPESPLADNAQYWIGECFFSQEKYEEAIEKFNELILKYPHGDKIPSAYLKKGISLTELGRKEEALSVFKLLISKYPLSEETKLAHQKIKELSSENERY